MKIYQFLFLNLLAIPSFGENICQDVTFDECDLNEGHPTDTLYALDKAMCQEICQTYSNCNFFRFDQLAQDDNCRFFEANYRDSCNIVAAPKDRDVNECLSDKEPSCDWMIDEKCRYSGQIIYESTPGTITDATDCGDMCIIYEPLGCLYWVFNKKNETCSMYNSDNTDRVCSIVSGPQEPDIASCEASTAATASTAAAPETTTTTTSTSASAYSSTSTTASPTNSANRLR